VRGLTAATSELLASVATATTDEAAPLGEE